MSSSNKLPVPDDKELREMQRNLDQVMGALAEIKEATRNTPLGARLTYDVHMVSSLAHLRIPHMARTDCGCGGDRQHGIRKEGAS